MPWNVKQPDLKNNPLYLEPRVTAAESQLAEKTNQLSTIAIANQQNISRISNKQYIDKKYINEQYRPQYHFTPEIGFMNDPNGLVYLDGEYHLFYQYEPNKLISGEAQWGHAVSKDLVKWEHLPIAIPKRNGIYIWSGSCVIDVNNTSGFGARAMIAVYTEYSPVSGQSICLAYSTDKGRTFTLYSGNPIMTTGMSPSANKDVFRDPKVYWDNDRSRWVMVLACTGQIGFYTSTDLKTWTYVSSHIDLTITDSYECPSFVKMKLDGVTDKWVLFGGWSGKTVYWVGNFDGTVFTADSNYNILDFGFDFYALQTWDNVPDGKIYAIAWVNNWAYANYLPRNHFTGMQSLTRKLTLATIGGVSKLLQTPIDVSDYAYFALPYSNNLLNGHIRVGEGRSLRAKAVFDLTNLTSYRFGLDFLKHKSNNLFTRVRYDVSDGLLIIQRDSDGGVANYQGLVTSSVTLPPKDNKIELEIFVDRGIIEVFANGGEKTLTCLTYPDAEANIIEVFADGGVVVVDELTIDVINTTFDKGNFKTNLDGYNIAYGADKWAETINGLQFVKEDSDNSMCLSDTSNKTNNFTYTADVTIGTAQAISLYFKADYVLNNFYAVTLDKTTQVLKIWKKQNSIGIDITSVSTTVTEGTTYNLKIVTTDTDIKIYLDNTLLLTASENSLPNGLFGFGGFNVGSGTIQNLYVY